MGFLQHEVPCPALQNPCWTLAHWAKVWGHPACPQREKWWSCQPATASPGPEQGPAACPVARPGEDPRRWPRPFPGTDALPRRGCKSCFFNDMSGFPDPAPTLRHQPQPSQVSLPEARAASTQQKDPERWQAGHRGLGVQMHLPEQSVVPWLEQLCSRKQPGSEERTCGCSPNKPHCPHCQWRLHPPP